LGKAWPAVDVSSSGDPDLILAAADDYSPTAVEERDGVLRIFFPTSEIRDRAALALGGTSIDVDDEDWAKRAQPMEPITVGRITVVISHRSPVTAPDTIAITIPPSMGFGTGHHATTRLCLAALQQLDLRGKLVLDVGTGSGLLAIAASKLGAARSIGTDDDADAIQAARDNLDFNHVTNVELVVSDLMTEPLPQADVVLANLMGALIVRAASRLIEALKPGGVLILSGVLETEREDIRRAFANHQIVGDVQEDEWCAFTVKSAGR
jgi:ribosomal protein L11 methyltransferase